MKRWGAVLLALGLMASACSGSGGDPIEISDVRIGQPTGPNAALYMTVASTESDRLIGGSTEVAASVMTHETEMGNDGTMKMVHVYGFALEPGQDLVLEPGGSHIMLVDVDRLEVGDTVDVILVFEKAGEVTIQAPVVEAMDTMDQ